MSERRPVGRLHVITDEVRQTRFSHSELARLAVSGGADTVQYREKRGLTTARRLRQMREILASIGRVPLVVNDRVDLALACGAWGVHIGPTDLDPLQARRLLGEERGIGATANDEARAGALAGWPIDYLGVGPVFGTASKSNPAPRLGLERLRRIVEASEHPVVAIGGITAANAGEVLETGVHGVAVLSAIVCCADPAAEAFRLREAISRHLVAAGGPVAVEGSR